MRAFVNRGQSAVEKRGSFWEVTGPTRVTERDSCSQDRWTPPVHPGFRSHLVNHDRQTIISLTATPMSCCSTVPLLSVVSGYNHAGRFPPRMLEGEPDWIILHWKRSDGVSDVLLVLDSPLGS